MHSDSLYTVLKVIVEDSFVQYSLMIPGCTAYRVKTSVEEGGNFFAGKRLGTVIELRCSACRCGKCPFSGSRYSHREETELRMIDEGLSYDEEKGYWVACYPFMFPWE